MIEKTIAPRCAGPHVYGTGEELNSPPPTASTDPQKTGAAPSAAASPPGNPRGSDGPTENACNSASGTRCYLTTSGYKVTLGTTTAPTSMLVEILGPRTSRTEEDLRGRDRSRLLETTSALDEVLGDGTTAGAPGGALGRCTPAPTGNPRGTDGPAREEALARGFISEEPRFSSSSFSLEQKPDPSSFRQAFRHKASRHIALTKLSPFPARHASHLGRASLNFPSLPHVPSGYSQPASGADLVRADPLKAQDGYSLEMSNRTGGRSRIEVPYRPGGPRDNISLQNPFRSSMAWPVRSLSRSRRTSPGGSLSHLRKISLDVGSSIR